MTAHKADLRRDSRRFRKKLGEETRAQVSRELPSVLTSFFGSDILKRHWGLYRAYGSEWSLEPLAERILDLGGELSYPRIQSDGVVEFIRVDDQTQWMPNRFGIEEPLDGKVESPDWILVPGLVFRRDGFRLGYGGGYYDRYLASHSEVKTVSVVLPDQLNDDWDPEAWDQPVEHLLTLPLPT